MTGCVPGELRGKKRIDTKWPLFSINKLVRFFFSILFIWEFFLDFIAQTITEKSNSVYVSSTIYYLQTKQSFGQYTIAHCYAVNQCAFSSFLLFRCEWWMANVHMYEIQVKKSKRLTALPQNIFCILILPNAIRSGFVTFSSFRYCIRRVNV